MGRIYSTEYLKAGKSSFFVPRKVNKNAINTFDMTYTTLFSLE